MTFEEAVQATPEICHALRPGKQSLKREHRNQVTCDDPRRFTGSIDLDSAVSSTQPHANRWDYGLGFRERNGNEVAIWIEVHPASTSEVNTVLRKLDWLRNWLRDTARDLHRLSERDSNARNFFWLATSAGVYIRPGTPQARRLQQAGLDLPRRVLRLG